MTTPLQLRGHILPSSSGACGSSCAPGGNVGPFDLAFRQSAEAYARVRSGDAQIQTQALDFVPLPVTESFTAVELLAVKSSAPVTLRINGEPAKTSTLAAWPIAILAGATLSFGVDGYLVTATFAIGEDTPEEAARRINAAAALAGVPFHPARVLSGQVEIHGEKSGPYGSLTPMAGDAAAILGLASFAGAAGRGAELELDGVAVWQFRRAQVRRVEISGSASVSVLAAGT